MSATAQTAVGLAAIAGLVWWFNHTPKASPRAAPAPTAAAAPARVESTLPLPGTDGRVHIVAIPGEFLEVTRCIVAVTQAGAVSTSCAPKGIELPPDAP